MEIKKSKLYIFLWKKYHFLKNWKKETERFKTSNKIRRFKNKGKGKPCVIIGNGPSLKVEDLTKLYELKIDTFACNRIHKVFEDTPWRPSYYFMSDNKLIESDHGIPEDLISDNMECFYPKRHMGKVGPKHSNYYLEFGFDNTTEGRFSLDAAKGVYPGCSVTTEMIQFAYYMGYNEIYLIGVDFNYTVLQKQDNNSYSYSNENNYFIKGYMKQGEIAEIPDLHANLLAFAAARESIEAHNVTIKNATRGGKLEVFDRVDLDTLFQKWDKNNH